MDDRELVVRILRGETWLFSVLVERYQYMMERIASRYLRNHEDARDVVQHAWEIAFKRLHRYEPARASVSTWLCETVIGLCWHVRRKRARVARSEATERCCMTEPLSPEERHELLVWHERLWAVLCKLSKLWQALLVLHLEEDWTFGQLGHAFHMTARHAQYETHKALAEAQRLALELRENDWRLDGAH